MPAIEPVDTQDPVLTTAAAARLLGVAVSTAQLWLESGSLPSWKTPGGHRRVRLSAVTRLLEEKARRNQAAAAPAAPAQDPADPEFQLPSVRNYPVPANERSRLAALQASGFVGSAPEPVFERLAWLASQVTGCPIGLITLLTSQRQCFMARTGIERTETPREMAFCSHAILQEEPLVVEDATRDARFADNAFVTGEAHIRFYAGIPLTDAAGHAFGTLCVLDREPRRLREREMRALKELAAIAVEEVRRRTTRSQAGGAEGISPRGAS
jgi:excisionase family DNA binding protein